MRMRISGGRLRNEVVEEVAISVAEKSRGCSEDVEKTQDEQNGKRFLVATKLEQSW